MSAKGRVALGNLCELPMIGAKPVDIVLEQVFFFFPVSQSVEMSQVVLGFF